MTAKRVEDLFLADDLRAADVTPSWAEAVDQSETQEDVEKIKRLLQRVAPAQAGVASRLRPATITRSGDSRIGPDA